MYWENGEWGWKREGDRRDVVGDRAKWGIEEEMGYGGCAGG